MLLYFSQALCIEKFVMQWKWSQMLPQAPKSLINSPFSIKELKEIEAVLDNVVIDATDA